MRITIAAIVVVIGAVVGLLVAELLVRLLMPTLPDTAWGTNLFCRSKEYNCRFMKPNVRGYISSEEFPFIPVQANSKGYRDTEWSEKRSRKHRVMVLGDSNGWGWGVPSDSMITTVLGLSDPDLAVYNLSIPGDDLFRMYSRYKYYVTEIDPTHVLILNCDNDFESISSQKSNYEEIKSKGIYDREDSANIRCDLYYKGSYKQLLNRSFLFRLANTIRVDIWHPSKDERVRLQREDLKRGYYTRLNKMLQDTTWLNAPLEFYRMLLDDMTDKHRVSILYIPMIAQVDSLASEQMHRLVPDAHFDPYTINRALLRLSLQFENVEFLDPAHDMRKLCLTKRLYFNFDSHPNSAGQFFLGNYLAERLKYR